MVKYVCCTPEASSFHLLLLVELLLKDMLSEVLFSSDFGGYTFLWFSELI